MHVLRTHFAGTSNVGLYGYVTEQYALLGEQLTGKRKEEVTAVLQVPLHHVAIAGTQMPGVFLAGNSHCVLAPGILFEHEREELEKLKIPVQVLETKHTCLGNNIVCNDHGAVISTDYSEEERQTIEAYLKVPVIKMDVAGLKTPGAVIVLQGEKGVVHRDVTDEEKHELESVLNVTLTQATANMGTPYLNAALLNNTNGFLIGDASGGPEIVHIDEVLYG
ncbi:MAG: translation initiation factor IF-6 [Candidatus Woesearchaeota archaeon]|nr:translation initiation factor IF-6 [Candidatus Woesearchaeota archaeon]